MQSKLTPWLPPNWLAIVFEPEGPTVFCRDHLIGTNFTITSAMVHTFGERSTCSLKLSILLIYYTTSIISTTTFALAFFFAIFVPFLFYCILAVLSQRSDFEGLEPTSQVLTGLQSNWLGDQLTNVGKAHI